MSKANRGKGFEWWLDRSFRRLQPDCGVVKIDPPVKILRVHKTKAENRMSQFVGCYASRSICDFEGWYNGLHVCCEAKDCTIRSAFYPAKALREHQMDRLIANDLAGGISFLALRFRADDPQQDVIAMLNVAGLVGVVARAAPRKGLRCGDFDQAGDMMLMTYGPGYLNEMEAWLEFCARTSRLKPLDEVHRKESSKGGPVQMKYRSKD